LNSWCPRDILFRKNKPWDAWSKLAKPAALLPVKPTESIVRAKRASMPSALESLPAELIAMILVEPSLKKRDIIALGLASTSLWLHVLQHVERHCWLTAAPLAGVEIACTGTYLRDLPESLATGNLVKSSVRIGEDGSTCTEGKINWASLSTYDFVCENSKKTWSAAFKAHNSRTASIPATLARKMAVELSSRCSAHQTASPRATWVLRNLTTKEYICCRPGPASQRGRGYVDHPDVARLRVDDVLLLRICWIRSPTLSNGEDMWLWLRHGSWAGHCFDIVPLEQGGVSAVGNGWKDSTDEIVKQARVVAETFALGGATSSPFRSRRKKATD
jgi:hypothetical protein